MDGVISAKSLNRGFLGMLPRSLISHSPLIIARFSKVFGKLALNGRRWVLKEQAAPSVTASLLCLSSQKLLRCLQCCSVGTAQQLRGIERQRLPQQQDILRGLKQEM